MNKHSSSGRNSGGDGCGGIRSLCAALRRRAVGVASETVVTTCTLTSTVADNGDLNPYAIIVAPVSAGQFTRATCWSIISTTSRICREPAPRSSTTIPRPKDDSLFAKLPQNLPQCPGGVGLTTAMTMLKSGWVIVGSTPSTDGTTRTKGDGGLFVLDSERPTRNTSGPDPNINGPWGNIALDR